jgi:hypothetical protein
MELGLPTRAKVALCMVGVRKVAKLLDDVKGRRERFRTSRLSWDFPK